MKEAIEVLDRIYFDAEGQPSRWSRWMNGQWKDVDCSMFPGGRPPFVQMNPAPAHMVYWESKRLLDGSREVAD